MGKGMLFKVISGLCAVAVTLGIYGCSPQDRVEDYLNMADSLMENYPDSALIILEEIDASELRGCESRARHALLRSMAFDKNYIDTTTFDVLRPAIDYYLTYGNADERLRTLYYKGRIHRNAGDDAGAMQSYLNALEFSGEVSDSITLARLLVAQGTLYYKQYRLDEFVENNIKAGEIYGMLGMIRQQVSSYSKALDGESRLKNKIRADSLAALCRLIVKDGVPVDRHVVNALLEHAVNFGNVMEVQEMINLIQEQGIGEDMGLNLAWAYSKIGEPEIGMHYLEKSRIAHGDVLDSLTYWLVNTRILENLGNHKEALDAFRNYSRLLEIYHDQLFSNELLFAEKKHEMEIENMAKLRKRDNMIKWILAGVIVLIIVTALIYYRYRMNKAGRLLAERNAEKLQLEGDRQRLLAENLAAEGEQLRLREEILTRERDRLQSEAEKLQKETEALREDSASIKMDQARLREKAERLQAEGERLRQESEQLEKDRDTYRLKSESLQSEMEGLRSEAENLHHQIQKLEEEQEELKRLVDSQETLPEEARQLIGERIGMLNGLIAQALTNHESYGKEFKNYIIKIKKDKKGFQDSLVKVLEATHPDFIADLKAHGLTERELHYACLYAIGLRGKEIGTYLGVAGHYNISAGVRRKLGLDPNDRNLGPYLRTLITKRK